MNKVALFLIIFSLTFFQVEHSKAKKKIDFFVNIGMAGVITDKNLYASSFAKVVVNNFGGGLSAAYYRLSPESFIFGLEPTFEMHYVTFGKYFYLDGFIGFEWFKLRTGTKLSPKDDPSFESLGGTTGIRLGGVVGLLDIGLEISFVLRYLIFKTYKQVGFTPRAKLYFAIRFK